MRMMEFLEAKKSEERLSDLQEALAIINELTGAIMLDNVEMRALARDLGTLFIKKHTPLSFNG